MSTIDTSPEAITTTDTGAARAHDADREARANLISSAASVLTSSDHKVIGRMFFGASLLALVACVTIGVLLGIERVDGSDTLFAADALPQMFVGFRIGLLYGVLVPIFLGLAVAVVPLQLGARALAFPRLAMAGFWAWVGGITIVIVALANNGGPGGGNAEMVDLFLAGFALSVIGLAAAALPVAATVFTTRAPGMRMERVPFFSWSALVAAVGLLLMLPVLVGVLIYLYVDHRYTQELFGGSDGINSWIGFALTQPTTYLLALPAAGVAAELIPVTFRTRMPMRGAVYTGIGLIGVAALSAVTQQANHDVPWAGSGLDLDGFGDKVADLLPYAFFTLLPILGVLIVMAVGALAAKPTGGRRRPRVTAPFVFAFLGLAMVFTGMLGGALVPIVDLGLQGTVFEEGALVYVVYGAVLAGFGGVAYWSPKLTGRLVPDKPAIGLAVLGFLATVLAALPYYIAGFADQPAASGAYDYSGPSELWNVLVTVGHGLMAVVILGFVGLAAKSLRSGPLADDDPWEAQTLEWSTLSPAPVDNFVEPPTVMSPEPLLDMRAAPAASEGER
jgi:heme/copper-type cytochrome/quinol oxidase subunit 1